VSREKTLGPFRISQHRFLRCKKSTPLFSPDALPYPSVQVATLSPCQEESAMHTKTHFHDHHFGLHWSPANVSTTILLTLFFVLLLFLFVTVTATPADGQNTAPPTARQAVSMPQYAARLSHHVSGVLASHAYSAAPRASFKNPGERRTLGYRGSPLDGNDLYDNGPINGTTDAWAINSGFVVSDTFIVPSGGDTLSGLIFGAWLFPGDVLQTVEISITSSEFGGTTYFDQVVNFTQSGCSGNQYGFNVCTETSSNISGPNLAAGTYWVNLQNAVVNTGDPIYWDENSGIGCGGQGCPSEASENGIGTIPSEAFTVLGENTTSTCYDLSSQYQREGPNGGFLHTFTSDEGTPAAGLAIDQHENLFGVTVSGGTNGYGLSYKLSQAGADWVFTPLYNFVGGLGGQNSSPEIVAPDGTLYAASDGGVQTCGISGNEYCGIVYRLRPPPVACRNALCGWSEEVLYQFTGDPDGWAPNGPPTLDQSGNVYGTTLYGGAYGQGTVFELIPSGGGWTEKIIHNFTGGSDGAWPNTLLSGPNGNLYGTTQFGGGGGGVIFQLAPSGSGWTLTVLDSFNGCYPGGGYCSPVLVQERLGAFYGFYQYNTQVCDFQCTDWTLGRAFVFTPGVSLEHFFDLGDTYYLYCTSFGCEEPGSATFRGITVTPSGQVYATSGYDQWIYFLGQLNALPSGQLFGYTQSDVWRDVEAGPSGSLYGTFGPCGNVSGVVW
jgi:uncharacterized repeat protein (TIGR03803 family)